MEFLSLKVEPGLEHIEENVHNVEAANCKEEQLQKFDQQCTNKETELPISPNAIEKAATNRTGNNVINKSYKKQDSIHLSSYLKKKFLEAFIENDCTSLCLNECLGKHNIKKEQVIANFGNSARGAQAFVHQECDSLCFSNITAWLKHFQALDVQQGHNFESAIIMNAIVNNEDLPNPESTGGVNLKSIYKFISNSLMGLPQKPLDPVSGKFLSCEFQNLINEANTDDADNDVRTMKIRLETALSQTSNQSSSSLDPLKFTDIDELLRVIMQTTTVNRKDCAIVKIEK